MDLGIAILGIVLIAIFVLPILIISRNSNRVVTLPIEMINGYAASNNCIISQFDALSDKLIGVDKENLKLFFIRKKQDSFQESLIDLTEVKKCQVLRKNKLIKHQEAKDSVLQKIDLTFFYFDSKRKNSLLNMYDAADDRFSIYNDSQLADKWERIVSALIESSQKASKTIKS